MTAIQGQGRQGDFVHANQKMASEQGFSKVSHIWYEKTISMSEGIDSIIDDAKTRQDVTFTPDKFRVVVGSDGKLALSIDGVEYKPTEHAWKHVCGWYGVPQTYFKMALQPILKGKKVYQRDVKDMETIVQVFNNEQRRLINDKTFIFRIDTNKVCRAMFSERYAIIDNVWYMETLANIFKDIGGTEPRLSHWRGNSDTVYGNLLIPDSMRQESDSEYGGMLSLSNCEIGKRRLSQLPSVFRAICMNGCIWDQTKGTALSQVHRGEIDLVKLRNKIFDNINEQIPLIDVIVTEFMKTKDNVIGKDNNILKVVTQLCLDNKIEASHGKDIVDQWVNFERDNENMFGLVNAITRAGQLYDADIWNDYDLLAGKIISSKNQKGMKSWDNFVSKSVQLTEQDMKEFWNQGV